MRKNRLPRPDMTHNRRASTRIEAQESRSRASIVAQ